MPQGRRRRWFAERSRRGLAGALSRTRRDFGGNVAVERLLPCGDLGNRFVDRVIAALFRRRICGGLGEALALPALVIGALLFIAIGAALTAPVAIRTAFMQGRPRIARAVVGIALAPAPIGVRRLSPSIVVPEVQAQLLIGLAVVARDIACAIVPPIIIAERLTPLVLAPLPLAPLLTAGLLLARLLAAPPLAALLILRPVVARAPRRLTARIAGVIVVALPRPPKFVRLTLASA
jgi:hypothetical protein